jgi:hypothetical protein
LIKGGSIQTPNTNQSSPPAHVSDINFSNPIHILFCAMNLRDLIFSSQASQVTSSQDYDEPSIRVSQPLSSLYGLSDSDNYTGLLHSDSDDSFDCESVNDNESKKKKSARNGGNRCCWFLFHFLVCP